MLKKFLTPACAFLLGFAIAETALAGDGAPQIDEALTKTPSAPYDTAADAPVAVAQAIARAAAQHKYVLLDFGGNWCPDCRVTAGVLEMDEVRPWIESTFEVVPIDVGRFNKNMDIAERYNVRIKAVPTIIILDQNGQVVNAGNPAALQDAHSMSPQAIVDTIYGWIHKPA